MTIRTPAQVDRALADLFSGRAPIAAPPGSALAVPAARRPAFSFLFFSDVRTEVSDRDKYGFTRKLVEFADTSGFDAVYFPERHFSEFGSIYANNAVIAAYFAPLTSRVRLRTAAVTNTLHHPAAIVESWAMIDILSGGRVDLGFGSGWSQRDFVLSPETYHDRNALRDERIPVIQRLWRGETVEFPGPGGVLYPTRVYPRPVQPELTVWYVTTTARGFEIAGRNGWNVFTMLSGIDLSELRKKIAVYRQARQQAGLPPADGTVSLMMHTLVHPDAEWVERQVAAPFKDYIRSSLGPHMEARGKVLDAEEIDKMVAYSYARYYQTGGIFGAVADCEKQVRKAVRAGVDEIVFLQDFGVDYQAVLGSLEHLEDLVQRCRSEEASPWLTS